MALGALIIVNVVFFQQGIMGWMQEKWPELFGLTVDESLSATLEDDVARALSERRAAE